MARDKEGKWIGYAEWKRRQIEAGKILPRVPVSTATARPEAKPPAPTLPPYSPEEEAAYMREWEKRHPTLGKVLRTWKSIAERTVATPWGQKVGEVVGRVLTGVEPTTPSPKVSKLGEVTAEIAGTGLAITGAMSGLGIPGAAAAPTVLRTGAMRVAPTAVVQAEKVLERLHPVLRRAGTAALVEAPAWWGYERALYPEEHKPPAEALPQYMWQFGAFAGAMEAAPRLIRYLRKPKAAPKAEAKPPEVKVEEIKPPAAEVKPPEVPTVEVKPPEAPVPKPPEVPPAEELPVRVGERMTARRKRTGKEYTGVVEQVFYGAPTKKGERPLLARIRLDDGTVKTIPASRKHTEWRIPETEAPKVEVPEAPKVEAAEVPPAPEVKPEVPPAPAKPYEGLRPGTEEWMRVWRSLSDQPEVQRAMAEYGKRVESLAARPKGATARVKTERGTAVDTEWVVADANDLAASHDTALRPDPRFPAELQPRERTRVASEEQVSRIAAELEPEFLGESPKASEGAPIVGPDGIVESGNARVIALKRLYERNHPNAEKYKQWLVQNAERFGLKPEDIERVERPVLVRVRKTEVDRPRFVMEANEPAVAAMSATEQAMADARNMPSELLDIFHPDETGNILVPENRDFVRAFMERVVSPAERGRYMTAEGTLSQEGVARIRNAVLAKAYGDPAVLAKLIEDPETPIRNIATALLRVAPRFAKLKEGIARRFYQNLDITPELNAAVRKIAALREAGQSVEAYLRQAMFLDDLSPLARSVLEELHANSRSSKRLAELLGLYADEVVRLGPPTQLFPGLMPTKEELWQRVVEATKAPVQQPVFFAPPGLPKGVTPSAPAEARTAVKEIVKTFERLGTPIRVGRYYEKARGIYKVRPETIRTKLWGDIVAISHEVGHHLDKLWKLSSIAQHRNELIALAEAVGAKGKTPADLAREGVAEFVRLAIADPATAQKQAPGMWKVWQDLLNQHPEVADVLEEAGRRIRGLMSANPEERLLSTMSVGEAPTRRRLFQSWNDFMAKMVDELAALDPFRQAAEAKLGRKLEPLEDPMMLAWRARGWQGRAQAFLRYGVRDAVGNRVAPGLQEALETATAGLRGVERIKRVNDFRAYAYARRLLEIEPRVRVLPGEATFGRQQVIADAQATLARLDTPAFRQAFDMLQQYQEQMLRQTLGESGLYTQEMIDRIIAENQAYLPLHRVFEAMEAGRARGAGRGYVDLQEAIRKLKGSGRLVIDPLESVVKNTYLFTSLAERNKVGVAIANLAEKAEGLGLWAERVMPKRYAVTVNLEEVLARADKELRRALEEIAADLGLDLDRAVTLFRPAVVGSPKENIAIVWRNGKAELWQFHPELYEALKWMDRETVGAIGRLLTYPAVILRAGAVWYNPVFWLRNPLRDQWTAFVFSKYGYIPGVDLVRGLFHLLRRDELYQLYHTSGAAQSTLVSFDRNYLQRDLRALLGQGKPSAINFLQDISEAMEIATRLGEFERGLAKLGRTEEGLLRAAIAARDITVDFGRAGTWGKVANRYAAFFNANVQGLDKMVRAFKEDPVGVTFRAILGVTLPSVALYLLNRRNPNYWALSDYERDLYWHFPLPDGRFVRIAKPFEVGVLFGSFPERVLSWVDKQDPSAVETLAGEMKPYLKNLAEGLIPNPIPTAAQPLVAQAWRPVVPAWERELPPEAQYSPFTSGVGRLVGKALGVSPRWFDWFVRNYVGGAGVFAVDVIDKALEAAGLPVPPARQGIPFLRDWIAKPTASTDPLTSQFYDAVAEIEGKVRAAKEAIKRGERERLTPEEFQMDLLMPYLNKQRELLSTLRRIQRMTMASPNLSDQEKQMVWEVLDSMMLNYVRSLFGMPMAYNPRAAMQEAQAVTQRAVLDYLRRQQILEEYQKARAAVTR